MMHHSQHLAYSQRAQTALRVFEHTASHPACPCKVSKWGGLCASYHVSTSVPAQCKICTCMMCACANVVREYACKRCRTLAFLRASCPRLQSLLLAGRQRAPLAVSAMRAIWLSAAPPPESNLKYFATDLLRYIPSQTLLRAEPCPERLSGPVASLCCLALVTAASVNVRNVVCSAIRYHFGHVYCMPYIMRDAQVRCPRTKAIAGQTQSLCMWHKVYK